MNIYYEEKTMKSGFDSGISGLCFLFIIIILVVASICSATEKELEYTANVSAYCPCEKCCGKWAFILPRRTASGHLIRPGDKFIAAPKNIPFGTMIDIPGYGCVPVLDRGGAIFGNKLDVYFDSHKAALNWGRQNLKVKFVTRD